MSRRLRPDEEALWRRVAENTTPLHPERPGPRNDLPAKPPAASQRGDDSRPTIPPFRVGQAALPPEIQQRTTHRFSLRIDRRMQRDLSRGKRSPEATIDLHGMTLAEAQPALTRFILASFATGRRLVLVITGKGRGSDTAWDNRKGALRREVPDWLAGAPLGNVVQEVLPAHRSHGGAGAYYIILRRG